MAKDSSLESNIIFEGFGKPDSRPLSHNKLVQEVGLKVSRIVERLTAETDPIVENALGMTDKIGSSKAKTSHRP